MRDPLIDHAAIGDALTPFANSAVSIWQPAFNWFGNPQPEHTGDLGIHAR
jgi:hypothetical protein